MVKGFRRSSVPGYNGPADCDPLSDSIKPLLAPHPAELWARWKAEEMGRMDLATAPHVEVGYGVAVFGKAGVQVDHYATRKDGRRGAWTHSTTEHEEIGRLPLPAWAQHHKRCDLWHAAHQAGQSLEECGQEGDGWPLRMRQKSVREAWEWVESYAEHHGLPVSEVTQGMADLPWLRRQVKDLEQRVAFDAAERDKERGDRLEMFSILRGETPNECGFSASTLLEEARRYHRGVLFWGERIRGFEAEIEALKQRIEILEGTVVVPPAPAKEAT